jgi:hypothetical protein
MKTRLSGAVCACLLCIIEPHAVASVVYSYTGNPYTHIYSGSYTDAMFITATLMLAQPLAPNIGDPWDPQLITPTAFSFSDGINTITDGDDGVVGGIRLTTDNAGNITSWAIGATMNYYNATVGAQILDIYSSRTPVTDDNQDLVTAGTCEAVYVSGLCKTINEHGSALTNINPGSWTVSTVPTPPALYLFGSGLIGLIGIARRKVV